MIASFKNQISEVIFDGKSTRSARSTLPEKRWKSARRKLDQLDSVAELDELKIPPGNRLERLSGDRKGQYGIRINDQYRIRFNWTDSGPDNVEVIDYH